MPKGVRDRRWLDGQRLYVVTWGTMTALVWAVSPENAELRVRHQVFDRWASLVHVTSQPRLVNGEVKVLREATDDDLDRFVECGGSVPA